MKIKNKLTTMEIKNQAEINSEKSGHPAMLKHAERLWFLHRAGDRYYYETNDGKNPWDDRCVELIGKKSFRLLPFNTQEEEEQARAVMAMIGRKRKISW